ncbi:MAG: C69 family dipeptidase [Candidatus Aminicenantes bacterium]|nr:C69 family dipeptidase [Candidatus Aminicenantes bacterium]
MSGYRRTMLVLAHFVSALVLFAAAPSQETMFVPEGRGGECYTVLVGRDASADGSVMVAHNEDTRGDLLVNLRKIRPGDTGARRRVALRHGGRYETDGRTAGFLWIEATGQVFCDSFVNEHGVLITSNSCRSRETADDVTDGGIDWMLRRLVAEKAASARDAVRMAGGLIETYGYRASGRTYSIADKNEAWMLAVIRGRHWFAQRVPDDEAAVIPNHYTIRRIRPDDERNFLGSRDIMAYARRNGWYDEERDGPFDFKKAFALPSGRDPVFDGNTLRHWRGLVLLTGRSWEIGGDYPFSVKPAAKVTAETLMALLRDHYEGTEYDATNGYTTGSPNRTKYRTICTETTINAFVASLNSVRPDPISVSMWVALGKPDTTVFFPFYYGVENLPPGAGLGTDTHDDEVLAGQHFNDVEFKTSRHQLLHNRVLELEKAVEADYGRMFEKLKRDLFPVEKHFVECGPKFERDFAALFSRNREEARKSLDAYVAAAFMKVSSLTSALLDY